MPTAGGTERRIQRPNRPRNPTLWASQPDGIVVAQDGSIISSNLKEDTQDEPSRNHGGAHRFKHPTLDGRDHARPAQLWGMDARGYRSRSGRPGGCGDRRADRRDPEERIPASVQRLDHAPGERTPEGCCLKRRFMLSLLESSLTV